MNSKCVVKWVWGLVLGLLFSGIAAKAQIPPPFLAIKSTGTNQFSITITNGVSTGNYELWWTPVLTDPLDNPWTMAVPGSPGQTNFLLPNWGYTAVFFRGVLDTNNPPLWQASNPNIPGSPILNVTILSPANGSVLQ